MKTFTQKILFGIAGKIGIVLLMAICFALFNSNAKAQTLLVNYDFAFAVARTPCTITPLTTAANVSSIFTIGGTNGETCATSRGTFAEPGDAFAESQSANLALNLRSPAIDAVIYFQVQLTGVNTYRGYKLYFDRHQSGTIDVQYSLDGTNFTSFTKLPRPILTWYFQPTVIDLSSITALNGQSTVYFRLEGKSNYNPGLNIEIDNFQVQATSETKSRKRVRLIQD